MLVSYSKSIMGCNYDRVIHPLKIDNLIISDEFQKADYFNRYFAAQMSISNNYDGLPTVPRLTYLTDDRLDIVTADESDVLKYLCKTDSNKYSGPEVISNHILKFCADSLYKPLTKLFNYSLRKGLDPSCWKIPNICPVYRNKGEKSEKSN